VADLLGNGAHPAGNPPRTSASAADVAAPVEFVAVPPTERNGHADPAHAPRRGGAGFEIDLADPRQRSHLPSDLRDTLPPRGIVNLVEARAVVERLERLIAERAPAPVGVLSLTAAQATLIRQLVARVPALAGADITVTVPPGLRQREVRTLVVSLTRSHVHRAVFYGEEPGWLPLALARGRERLILIGDLGTLARRAQWDGPLDHLDAVAARRERDFADHLVCYVQGRGRHAGAFRVLAGTHP
jgi:AAA domain